MGSRDERETGLVTVFPSSTPRRQLVIQENADPDVVLDLADFFERLAPENDRRYRHTTEGPDDMPAHIRAALTQAHPVDPCGSDGGWPWERGKGIYLFEHRSHPQRRSVVLHLSA